MENIKQLTNEIKYKIKDINNIKDETKLEKLEIEIYNLVIKLKQIKEGVKNLV
jgi:hypothetical protein